ncbi:class B sortase [Anaerocolumna xylanovorans]|nr:class B sortase [Anaerocolumna xylanovorans]
MKNINSNKLIKIIQFISLGVFLVCAIYLGYELILRPYLSQKAVTEARNLYNTSKEEVAATKEPESTEAPKDTLQETSKADMSEDSLYDSMGRLKEFSGLLSVNEDVKGWITIDGTNIDYPVLQSGKDDPEYYLHKNLDRKTDKAGSIFLDINSSVEENTQNMLIYGHNMKSTDNMFHYLIKYNDLAYYRKHPVITFDTLYHKGQWKIISIFKADANINDDFFDFTRTRFESDTDFLEYVYQLRIRSIYNIPVDMNEKDQIITLVTCSYELDNYRTVIVARKIRDGENSAVAADKAAVNPSILYPASWYANYGGTAPKTSSVKEALEAGQIDWYIKP